MTDDNVKARGRISDPKIITFGCRLNAQESEVMRAHIASAQQGEASADPVTGPVAGPVTDPVIVINSCAVTNEAVRQARQAVRKARRENPDAKIIVTGCAAQIDPDQFAAMDEVDHIIGNDEKMRGQTFDTLLQTQSPAQGFGVEDSPRVLVNDIMSVRENAPHMLAAFGARTRAYVQVQNGCDHRCTFCIIPYGRGNSRSTPAGEVVQQIKTLVDNGYREVVLTGVDITSYGADLPGKMSLGLLAQKILNQVPDLDRLRLSSIDSVEIDLALEEVIASEPRLMPHLHLSLQAGDNMILKRMKRRHDRDHSIAFCERMRKARPELIFGADLIAGFPTETDEMFENTLRLVDECDLTFLHIFPFSPRPGTPAARMPQLERRLIKERAAQLRARGTAKLNSYLRRQQGQTVELLLEKEQMGRTAQMCEMNIDQPGKIGSLVQARVNGADGARLHGTPLSELV